MNNPTWSLCILDVPRIEVMHTTSIALGKCSSGQLCLCLFVVLAISWFFGVMFIGALMPRMPTHIAFQAGANTHFSLVCEQLCTGGGAVRRLWPAFFVACDLLCWSLVTCFCLAPLRPRTHAIRPHALADPTTDEPTHLRMHGFHEPTHARTVATHPRGTKSDAETKHADAETKIRRFGNQRMERFRNRGRRFGNRRSSSQHTLGEGRWFCSTETFVCSFQFNAHVC